ncbi:hypothetical protein PH586_09650 [Pseudomonas sp. SA3-5]|uniref:Uncharacterized protein n=1 Tax=Pseudomonas aestuarii TaxID=3018340 RepID=A0ABT4XEN8_9PSED|nr:hypothetical protein [Pseudomonas aestuarii]MDA7086641.1 hypothetical protein [Pseudomonas aestuarii]
MSSALAEAIKQGEWWQGSVLRANRLDGDLQGSTDDDYWVIASQTCNLYSQNFEQIPVFEIVSAKKIEKPDPAFVKGDHPRILHVRGRLDAELVYFAIDIQRRAWLPRQILAEIGRPDFHLIDEPKEGGDNWEKNQWLDAFSGWLGRSYTRVALPDEFNDALSSSRIKEILHSKLTKHADKLYGIFISLSPDSDEPWAGVLGLMPPPYLLSIKLVTYNDEDPSALKDALAKQLFDATIESGRDETGKKTLISRADLARSHRVRIVKQSIEAVTTGEIYLDELKEYIRYSLVDHLSSASMASPA